MYYAQLYCPPVGWEADGDEDPWEEEVYARGELVASAANGAERGDGYDATLVRLAPEDLSYAPSGVWGLVRYEHVHAPAHVVWAWCDEEGGTQ